MEEEGVPSTALREVSLLQMLSETEYVVRCVRRAAQSAFQGANTGWRGEEHLRAI